MGTPYQASGPRQGALPRGRDRWFFGGLSRARSDEWRRRRGHYLPLASAEPLEPRWLLENSPISPAQRQVLLDGLDGLVAWADRLEDHDLAARLLPVVGQSLGTSLDLSDALDTTLVTPIRNYLTSDPTPTTDELVGILQAISGNFGNLTVNVNPSLVSGGLQNYVGGSEFVFHLVYNAQRQLTTGLSFGPDGEARGIRFGGSASANLTAGVSFAFTLGMDLNTALTPEEAFFIRVSQLNGSAVASAAGFSSVSVKGGFFDGSASGSMNLNATLGVSVANPDNDPRGNITLDELATTELDELVDMTPGGSASGTVTISVSPFGGFIPTMTPSVSFTASNPFDPPNLTLTNFDQLRALTNLNATSLLSYFSQLGGWLDDLAISPALDRALHLVTGRSLGEILSLNTVIESGLIDKLKHATGDLQGLPKFDSAQSLATTLQTALGLSPGTINARYDQANQELTYHVVFGRSFEASYPLNLDIDLASIANFSSTAQVEACLDVDLEFTFGVALSRIRANLVAANSAPANGRLTADAQFLLSVGGRLPDVVTVTAASTSTNNNRDDLVADLNAALASAGIGGDVVAALDTTNPTRLVFTTAYIGPVATLLLVADANNPAVTQLGFQATQFAIDSGLDDLFVEDAELSASVMLSVPDLDASARFSMARLNIVNGTATANFNVDLALKDPGSQTVGGRVYLNELYQSLFEDVTQVVQGPEFSGALSIYLPVTAQLLNVPVGGNPNITVTWPNVFTGSPQVNLNNFQDLFRVENLTETLMFGALQELGNYLTNIQGFSLFEITIPGINKSLADIFDYAERFISKITQLSADPNGLLDQLEAKLEQVLGLTPPELDLSFTENNSVLRVDLTLAEGFSSQIPVNLQVSPAIGRLLDLSGSALLSASANATLDLDFGIDLTNPTSPRPFFYETTDLTLQGKVLGTDIDFAAALGPLGLFIINGTLAIDGDGNAATPNDVVTLIAALTDQNATTTEGKIYVDQFSLNNVAVSLDGKVRATLPTYFPTSSTFQGNIELTIGQLNNIGGTITLTFPDFNTSFLNFDLLNNLSGFLNTLDFILANVRDGLNGEVFGVRLPFVGENLEDAANFVEEIRVGLLHELRNRLQESHHSAPGVVQQALFDALGPARLNLLGDRNNSSTITPEDILVQTIDRDFDGQQDDEVKFDMILTRQFAIVDQQLAFDLGLPALA